MKRKYLHRIYEQQQTFYNGYESFCYQNCLKIILEAKQIKNAWLYINSCASMEYRGALDIRCHNDIRGLLPNLQSKVKRFYEEKNTLEVFIDNCNFISQHDEPIIVGADTYYLPYASNYKKNHAKHTLVLCGFDIDKEEVYVIDWYTPWFYKGSVKLSNFLLARESLNENDGTIFSGEAIKNNWAYIDTIAENELSEYCAFRDVVNESIKLYYSNNKDSGASILTNFKNDVLSYIKYNDNQEKFSKLYKIILLIAKRHNFFLSYLENSQKLFSIDMSELISAQKEIILKWDAFLMVLLKLSFSLSERTIKRFTDVTDDLISLEKEFADKLNNFYCVFTK